MTFHKMPVMFRAERSGPFKGDVTAVFPTLPSDCAGRFFTVYAHIGQHSSGSDEWLRSTRTATDAEASELLEELRGIYTTRPQQRPDIYGEPVDLVPVKRRTAAHRRKFVAAGRSNRLLR